MIGTSVMTVHLQFKHNINKPEKKWKCQFCGKAFRGSSNLRDHENTHTGARPHMCKNCGKCFARSGSYTNHVRSCTKSSGPVPIPEPSEVGSPGPVETGISGGPLAHPIFSNFASKSFSFN